MIGQYVKLLRTENLLVIGKNASRIHLFIVCGDRQRLSLEENWARRELEGAGNLRG
jgi:hypothetical protein